jgi:hypothetical protein
MPKTIDSLYSLFENNNAELSTGILVDYFGISNWTQITTDTDFHEKINLFMGLYKGLYIMNISKNEIESHFKSNSLDALMDNKYTNQQSGYYNTYKKENIKIGHTFYTS